MDDLLPADSCTGFAVRSGRFVRTRRCWGAGDPCAARRHRSAGRRAGQAGAACVGVPSNRLPRRPSSTSTRAGVRGTDREEPVDDGGVDGDAQGGLTGGLVVADLELEGVEQVALVVPGRVRDLELGEGQGVQEREVAGLLGCGGSGQGVELGLGGSAAGGEVGVAGA